MYGPGTGARVGREPTLPGGVHSLSTNGRGSSDGGRARLIPYASGRVGGRSDECNYKPHAWVGFNVLGFQWEERVKPEDAPWLTGQDGRVSGVPYTSGLEERGTVKRKTLPRPISLVTLIVP